MTRGETYWRSLDAALTAAASDSRTYHDIAADVMRLGRHLEAVSRILGGFPDVRARDIRDELRLLDTFGSRLAATAADRLASLDDAALAYPDVAASADDAPNGRDLGSIRAPRPEARS